MAIGTLAIKLTANPTGLHSALDQAEKKVGQFAGNVSKLLLSPLTGLSKAASVPANAVKSFLAPIQSLLTSIPFIGGALAAVPLTGAGFTQWIKEGISEITAIGKEADKLGVNVKSLSALLAVAGSSGDALITGFGHLERQINSASHGGRDAEAAFEALGLSGVQLAQMLPDDAFLAVAQAIRKIDSAYGRAAAAQDIFGKAGLELLPLLGKNLKEATAWAERMGLTFDKGGLAEAKKAAAAMREIDAAVTGLKRQLAIASAPFITELVKWITQLIDKSGGIKTIVVKALDALVSALATVADGLRAVAVELGDAADAAKGPTWKGFFQKINPINLAVSAGVGMAGIEPGTDHALKLPEFGRALRETWAKARSNLTGDPLESFGVAGMFLPRSVLDKLGAGKTDYDPDLGKRVGAFLERGQSPFQKLKDEIADLDKFFDKGARNMARYKEGLRIVDDEMLKLTGLTKTPLESFQEQMKTVKEVKGVGRGDLAARLAARSFDDLKKSVASTDTTGSFGVEAGTLEDAQRTIRDLNQQHHDQVMNVIEDIRATLQRALQVQTETDQMTAKVAAALEQIGVVN